MPATAPDASPPRLYAARLAAGSAPVTTRIIAALVAMGCLIVLSVAAWLEPSRSGVGSHKSLGMQSCTLLERSGIPCPSCGMTTSFTWFAEGNLLASFYVQPMGFLLALSAACCVWAGTYIAVTGRPLHRLLTFFPAGTFLLWILLFFVLAWGWKILIQFRGIDGWA